MRLMLAFKNVTKKYGKHVVLSGASFSVGPKDCVCIVGNGGSGKSTIVSLLIRADDPTSGTVEVDGISLQKVPPLILQLYRRRLGIAFQEPTLLMRASVAENIALPLEMANVPPAIVTKTVDDLIVRLGLETCAQRIAEQCSMSERALTSLARAIITSPMILLADEPLQHLDGEQVKRVMQLIKAMQKRGTTCIFFSRTVKTATAFDARILQLQHGTVTEAEERPSTFSPETTHRILEETEEQVHKILDMKQPRKVGVPKNDKKIRITSIGSGL